MSEASSAAASPRQPRLFASLTSLDLLTLGESVRRLLDAGVDGLHVDVADGSFVPFLMFPPRLLGSLRGLTDRPIDVHLMVRDPEPYLHELARQGPVRAAFHVEATRHPWRVCSLARRLGLAVSIAANPVTPLDPVVAAGGFADGVLLLAADHDVEGDRPVPIMLDRISLARSQLPPAVPLEVDGGLGPENLAGFVAAGGDDLVVGRALCSQPDLVAAVRAARAAMSEGLARRDAAGD